MSNQELDYRLREADRDLARLSPAGLAEVASEGRWKLHPHMKLLNHHLLEAVAGRTKRLIVMMPPQHGKSTLTSEYFPAWYLGTHPEKRVILASYEADFAASWGKKVRSILEEHGRNLFGVGVQRTSSASDRWDIDAPNVPTQHSGGMMTAGIGGPVTGKKADLLIIDDPVKNAVEAMSETTQKRNYDWYLSTALTRVSENGIVIIIQTRWAVEDLAGKLIKDMETKGEQFKLVSLPAIALQDEIWETGWTRKKGEPLCPGLFSLATLLARQRAMTDYLWSSLYQQSPLPLGGSIFKAGYFEGRWTTSSNQPGYYRVLDYNFDMWAYPRFVTVDSAMTEKEVGEKKAEDPDYTVIGTWCVLPIHTGTLLLLLDVKRGQWATPGILDAMREVRDKWRPGFIAIESVGGGLALFQMAQKVGLKVKKISKSNADDVFLQIEGDKVARAIAATDLMNERRFFLPDVAVWIPEYLGELLAFPLSAKKDQVDMTAYAVAIAEKYTGRDLYAEMLKGDRVYPEVGLNADAGYNLGSQDDVAPDPMEGFRARG